MGDPKNMLIRGLPDGTIDMNCGPQKSVAVCLEYDPPPADDALASAPGGTSAEPGGDLSGRLRGLGGGQAGSIIIYRDVHKPAIQNVQPTLDKTQPPLIRGGHENEVPQA